MTYVKNIINASMQGSDGADRGVQVDVLLQA
jgi:hypothetical protein